MGDVGQVWNTGHVVPVPPIHQPQATYRNILCCVHCTYRNFNPSELTIRPTTPIQTSVRAPIHICTFQPVYRGLLHRFHRRCLYICAYVPRSSLFVVYHVKERIVLSLKCRGSYMYCTHCVLPSRLRSQHPTVRIYQTSSSSDDEGNSSSVNTWRLYVRNRSSQMLLVPHHERGPTVTMRIQLRGPT